jgi:hypothetical protein
MEGRAVTMKDKARKISPKNSVTYTVKLGRSTSEWINKMSEENEIRKSKICEVIIEAAVDDDDKMLGMMAKNAINDSHEN